VLGFRVLGFRVLGFRVLGFRVLRFRVLGSAGRRAGTNQARGTRNREPCASAC